jgi:hypothetical protein
MSRFLIALLLSLGAVSAQAQRVEVFYLSAPDCRYCAHWESQSREAFLESPEGRAVNFVEIRGETLRRPIEARHYPPEHRWVFEQIGPSRGVPRFLIAVDRKVVMSAFGTGGYQTKFLPALKAVLANQPPESRPPGRTRT